MASNYENSLSKKLRKLPIEDICLFAWLSAVRALPLVGLTKDTKVLDHIVQGSSPLVGHDFLLTLLMTLDVAVLREESAAEQIKAYALETDRAAIAARLAASIYASTDTAAVAHVVAHSIQAASHAAKAAHSACAYTIFKRDGRSPSPADANSAYRTAVSAATAAAVSTANAARLALSAYPSNSYSLNDASRLSNLQSILRNDLESIVAKKYQFAHGNTIYGEIWYDFVDAMNNAGCEYWGNWYASVFNKGFLLDDGDFSEIAERLSAPPEFVELGAARVARYITENLEYGAGRLNETRVLILGDKGSGKTSLALRLKNPLEPMPDDADSTEGVDVTDWHISSNHAESESELNVHIWDFAGHVITHAAHRCFMSERCLYILLINGRTEGENRIEYWLEQIRNYGGNSPILVLVNIMDRHRIEMPENTLRKEFPAIEGFYYVDIAAGGEPLEEFRQAVINSMWDNPLWRNQRLNTPAFNVKEELNKRFSQGNEFIERDAYDAIAEQCGVLPENYDQVLNDLHDLGICLCYNNEDMKDFDNMVLNPSWISQGMYRMINWGLENGKHILSKQDFCKAFSGIDATRYPTNKAGFLFRLMKTYQLAFFANEEEVFVPLLLPIDRIDDALLPAFPFGERLRAVYKANQALPPYTVSRLAVLHSKELIVERSWRFGALFYWEDTAALVEESERSRTISVFVKGPNRTEYISRLRDTLKTIFDDYQNSSPELKYEVLLPQELAEDDQRQLLVNSEPDKFLQTVEQITESVKYGQKIITGCQGCPLIDPVPTQVEYNIVTVVNPTGPVYLAEVIDQHQTINIEFNKCSINLQAELRALARSLRKLEDQGDIELAEELEDTAADLGESTELIPPDCDQDSPKMEKTKEILKKKGLLNRLENLYDDLCDENSELRKKARRVRNGVKSLMKLAKHYNEVAQWIGLPQVPSPLLELLGEKG